MNLERAIEEFVAHPEVVVGIDFDGTIASLVDHPDLAVPHPGAVEALRALAAKEGVRVVVISGRSHAALSERLGEVDGVIYIGEHGNDTGDHRSSDHELVDVMGDLVEDIAEVVPGSVTERKTHSATFHYRNVPDDVSRQALERIRAWLARHPEVMVIEGKNVVELTISARTKGDAVMELAGDEPVVYIGDDTTDESVFEVLRPGDVGVKVGEGPTRARFRVEDVAEVVRILEQMVLASG